MKRLLLGAETIAQGAIDSGISGVYSYPGTPSTEITLYIQEFKVQENINVFCNWCTNEKTAMETALGMSYAGKRSLVSMKHVGLNVAADAFINSAITGINGGLVVAVADDPSMHSSQNEQDSRFYGHFAHIPIFEPSNQQEAYDMTRSAFRFSEKYKLPVLLRITTRLAHSRAIISTQAAEIQNNISFPLVREQFILLPSIARKQFRNLLLVQNSLKQEAVSSIYNQLHKAENSQLGVIACGIAINYLLEVCNGLPQNFDVLKLCQYPIPQSLVNELFERNDKILVLEDGYPFVEEKILGIVAHDKRVLGRLNGYVPPDGELQPNIVAKALAIESFSEHVETNSTHFPNRPPELCKGCGHIDMYTALRRIIDEYGDNHVFADIGCYTLGALSPYSAINTCVEMGASIPMAKGAADAGVFPAIAIIGDSTFTHSGMTGLLDAVNENAPITVIIADNAASAMTGGQNSAAHGKLKNICIGLGVEPDHIIETEPFPTKIDQLVALIKEEIEFKGTSVIILKRECVQTVLRKNKTEANQKHNIIF
ncbi:MAG: indolepyruvate ferredoxin oxidoreductase [Bacteroidales bacterium]|nr:indolepyruvate ferredoxin oxidoreductase [Bacteroidales bacterium]